MAIRIYSLAKDLGLDSKELVDLCARIGIQGKGSALASLEEDEILRIKKHLEEKSAPSAPVAKEALKPQRETPKEAPIRDLGTKPQAPRRDLSSIRAKMGGADRTGTVDSATTAVAERAPTLSEEPPSAEVPDQASASDIATQVSANEISEETRDKSSPRAAEGLSRDDFYSPADVSGKMRVIGRGKSTEPKPSGESSSRVRKTRDPVININLAKIPKSAGPSPAPKPAEPVAQKPIVKLTPDVLKGVQQPPTKSGEKSGSSPSKSGTGTGRATAPSQTQHAGLTEFKQAAENKLNQKHRKPSDDVEEPVRKKGLASLEASRSERSSLRNATRIQTTRDLASVEEEEERRAAALRPKKKFGTATGKKEKISLTMPCTIRSFCEAAGVTGGRVLRSLMGMGTMANINASLTQEQAELVAIDLGVEIEFKQAETLEDSVIAKLDSFEDNPDDLVVRPPIVTFLGHVDHGKTSLLDYLIGTKIVAGEAGGITQHIRAYQVKKDGRAVSFVDTPGHEAFTEMRARGANVTDIAILVVAADDGIMPQTEEAISHAKAAGVPIVVAANKCDLPGADVQRIMTQMTEHGLTPSAWGGDVEVVQTSAITGQGMDELLDTILTVAELHDYKANPKRAAMGVCLESEQSADRGVIAKVMVRTGTLRVGDIVVCGSTFGRVKALYDTLKRNKQMTESGPSMPVNITGLEKAPEAGEKFYVIDDIAQARQLAAGREQLLRKQSLSGTSPKVSFETFQELLQSGKLGVKEEKVTLNLIVRADARGSLEAIEKELGKLDHPEVEIRILQKSVGGITVADVTLASASQAVIVGFNVIPDEAARALADTRNVEIRRYDIIYNLAQDIRALIEGKLKPEEKVIELGRALVKQVFSVSRVGTIAGCYVAQGTVERGCRVRVNREGRKIGDYVLDTLKRVKEDVKEVNRGMECGIKLGGFNDVKVDDVLEAYRIEEVARTLGSSKS
ncbi:MAG: translation initiation factor IF-2 [Planctomycetes bacterium]|nr:translation initiation factor IF-2 [Planctomycetota bacterium]